MLKSYLNKDLIEAGCDEAGRGCLAGSVFAAAVILPKDYTNEELNDSKKLSETMRYKLRETIERDALAWAIGIVTPEEIDKINIPFIRFKSSISKRQINKLNKYQKIYLGVRILITNVFSVHNAKMVLNIKYGIAQLIIVFLAPSPRRTLFEK